jgi:hypothetical protein
VSDWLGSTPVFLVIQLASGEGIGIDLDEPGWAKTYAEHLRVPSIWRLFSKDQQPRLVLNVFKGEQPYYTARHVGIAGSGGTNEIIAYGIGKKRGRHVERLWLLPDGSVCSGDDLEILAIKMLHEMGPRKEPDDSLPPEPDHR